MKREVSWSLVFALSLGGAIGAAMLILIVWAVFFWKPDATTVARAQVVVLATAALVAAISAAAVVLAYRGAQGSLRSATYNSLSEQWNDYYKMLANVSEFETWLKKPYEETIAAVESGDEKARRSMYLGFVILNSFDNWLTQRKMGAIPKNDWPAWGASILAGLEKPLLHGLLSENARFYTQQLASFPQRAN